MDVRGAGVTLIVIGAVAQLGGLVIDARLHAADPGLAAREPLLTTGNVGHVLLLGGLALVVTGAVVVLAARRAIRLAVPMALLAVLGGGTAVASGAALTGDASDHHQQPAPATTTPGQADDQDRDHDHGDGTRVANQPLDAATRDQLASELTVARAAALRHPTVASATAAGYRKVTEYIPGIGAHFMKFALVDGHFDVTQPEMLLYDGAGPDARVAGLSYYVVSATEPPGFTGPNDHWHQHLGLCLNREFLVIGGSGTTDEECRARGGTKASGTDGWMVHAWVVPGWESPEGVFSAENSELR